MVAVEDDAIARSTAEAERMALGEATRGALALRRLAMELGILGAEVIPIMEERGARGNVSSIMCTYDFCGAGGPTGGQSSGRKGS